MKLLVLILFVVSCNSKKSEQQPSVSEKKTVEVKSKDKNDDPSAGIVFTYKENGEDGVLAKVGEEQITLKKLFPNPTSGYLDLVLQEREELIRNSYFYFQRDAQEKKSKFSGTMTFFFEAPKRSPREIIGLNKKDRAIKFKFSNQSEGDNIVSFNGENLSAQNIAKNSLRYWEIKNRQFSLTWNRLKSVVTNRRLLKLAKEKGLKIEEYVGQEILPDVADAISEDEFSQFLEKKKISRNDLTEQTTKTLKEIALQDIKNIKVEKFVANKFKSEPIEVYFKRPTAQIEVKPEWVLFTGPENAKKTVYTFSNYSCRPCREAENHLVKLTEQFPGQIRVGRIPFFSDTDRISQQHAEASACLFKQDRELFSKYIGKVFSGKQVPPDNEVFEFITSQSGDVEAFKKCYLTRELKSVSSYYKSYNKFLGVSTQPTVLAEGAIFTGVIPFKELYSALAEGLEKSRNPTGEKSTQQSSSKSVGEKRPGIITKVIQFFKNLF